MRKGDINPFRNFIVGADDVAMINAVFKKDPMAVITVLAPSGEVEVIEGTTYEDITNLNQEQNDGATGQKS